MRKCITSALAIVAGCAMTMTTAQAEKLVVTTFLPPTHWAATQGGLPFLECVKSTTNGEVDFDMPLPASSMPRRSPTG